MDIYILLRENIFLKAQLGKGSSNVAEETPFLDLQGVKEWFPRITNFGAIVSVKEVPIKVNFDFLSNFSF